jgi:hypothetical protein
MKRSSANRRAKAQQVSKLAAIREALTAAGCDTAAKQAAVLGVSRSTAWALLKLNKRAGPSAIVIKRILLSPNLPPAARRKFEEYIDEKIRGLYGHSERRTRAFHDHFRIPIAASTTSLQDSGLFGHLLPIFVQKTGITVEVVAAGTGRALDAGRRGGADIVFAHAKSAELRFLAEREGLKRFPLMYNDFVLVGPSSDPAGIKGMKDVAKAFRAIKDKRVTFISRGDRSGTHLAELIFWNMDRDTDIKNEKGPWYKSTGQGMGET